MTLQTLTEDFLAQKRIAVTGVSGTKENTGNIIYRRLRDSGYEAIPVNPAAGTFEGVPCYPDLKSIPGGVDGVVMINRPEVVEQLVHECAEAGIKRVWMHNNTFGGSSVSPQAVEYCREHNIAVIAGACPLMFGQTADFGHKCMRWMLGVMGRLPK